MTTNRLRNVASLLGLALLAAPWPAQAAGPEQQPLACWFYQYRWVYYRMVPNTAPPTVFATNGVGTGLMATSGGPPSEAETEALVADIQGSLPRGDAAAPPPRASIQNISRVACPKSLAGMDLPSARIILHQPEPPPAPRAPAAPRR